MSRCADTVLLLPVSRFLVLRGVLYALLVASGSWDVAVGSFFFKRGILQYENRPKSPPDTKSTFMPGDYFHSSTTARRLGMWTIRCPVIFHNQICHMMDNAPAQF